MPLLIFTYSMMGLFICKHEPFWQEVFVDFVTCTQVTVKARGPLDIVITIFKVILTITVIMIMRENFLTFIL